MVGGAVVGFLVGTAVGPLLGAPGTIVDSWMAMSEAATLTDADAKTDPAAAFDAIAEASAPLETAAVNCNESDAAMPV